MIWHLLEIWLALFVTFVIGCALGSVLYSVVGRSALAGLQGRIADAVGDYLDGLRVKLGMAPVWAEGYRRPPRPEPVRRGRPGRAPAPAFPAPGGVLDDDDDDFEIIAPPPRGPSLPAPPPRIEPEWEREPEADRDDGWEGREDWEDDALEDIDGVAEVVPEMRREPPRPPVPELPAMRPAGLASPRNGVPDDLQRIRGIGRRNEELLNSLGIFHFSQIAAWTPAEVRWIGNHLSFPERVERDDWIGQATILGSGGDTGYVKADRRRAAEGDEELPASDG